MEQFDFQFLEFKRKVFWIRLSSLLLLIGDVLAFLLSGMLALLLAPLFSGEASPWIYSQDLYRYWAWVAVCNVGLLLFLVKYRHYSDRKPFWTELSEMLIVVILLALIDVATIALAKWNASRLWWLITWVSAAISLPLVRTLMRLLLTKFGLWLRPTLLIGSGQNALDAVAALQSEPAMGFDFIGFIDVTKCDLVKTSQKIPIISAEQAEAWAKVPGVQFVIALEHAQHIEREKWLRTLTSWGVHDINVIPAMRGVPLFGTDISFFFSHEVAMLKLRNNLRYLPARFIKRLFDIAASLLILALVWPLFALLAFKIRQDGGPIIFQHQRVGRLGKPFKCYKLRTMSVDAENKLQELLALDTTARNEWESEFKLKNDPRISDIGHILRRTSLDELPQLFNVIKGEMSLVGPRPVIEAELSRYGDDVEYFLMVRPGMTGLWQVSGRNDVSYDNRVYLDTWYVKNWSLWFDIAILFKTIRVVFNRDGAY